MKRSPLFQLVRRDEARSRAPILLTPGETVLGRDLASGEAFSEAGVSRRHAVIRFDQEGLRISDLGSKNGTLVNGAAAAESPLWPGDEIRLGPVTLELVDLHSSDQELAILGDAPSGALPTAEPTPTLGAPGPQPPAQTTLDILCALLSLAEPASSQGITTLAESLRIDCLCLLESTPEGVLPVGMHGPLEEVPLAELERLTHSLPTDEARGPNQPVAGKSWQGVLHRPSGLGLFFPKDPESPLSEELAAPLLRLFALARGHTSPPVQEHSPVRHLVYPEGYIEGRSPAASRLRDELQESLQGDLPVLLTGPTGVGKDLLSRTIHASSERSRGPFVAVNCAAIPADLLEAELFGIEAGVATGVAPRLGSFPRADGGVLFLDEIGDMPSTLQAKLLRVLDHGEVTPVGGTPKVFDVRIVAATHADLLQRIDDGSFRSDLYFRISGFVLEIPSLVQRREDLPTYIEAFVARASLDIGKRIRGMTSRALRQMTAYPWPGNLRELKHEVSRLVYRCPPGGAIDSSLLPSRIQACDSLPSAPNPVSDLDLNHQVSAVERRLILAALDQAGGNRSQASRLLAISRNGLLYRMRRLGLVEDPDQPQQVPS